MREPMGVTLLLPWLDSKLSPNARHGWAVRWKALKPYKEAATVRAIEAHRKLGRTLEPPVVAQWIFIPPDKRLRDIDNLTSNGCMKAAIDACVMVGLLVDDNHKVLSWAEPDIWDSYPNSEVPGVVLLLDEAQR